MSIRDWLGNIFKPPSAGVYHIEKYRTEAEDSVSLDTYALFTVVHLIASLISACEFKVFRRSEETKGEEWVSLNIRPNDSQNAEEWKNELVSRLLLSGEVLCFQLEDGQRIIAETFNKTEYAVYEDKFDGVTKAGYTMQKTYRTRDVIYLRTPINVHEIWLSNVVGVYESLMRSAVSRLNNADGEKGILNISAQAQGDKYFEKKFQTLMTEYFKGYFANKNAVLPLYEGYEYKTTSGSSGGYTNDLSTIKTLADEALARACQAFGVPPSYVRGEATGILDTQQAMLTNCIKPLARMISSELTAKLFTLPEMCDGCRIEVDTSRVIYRDLLMNAANTDKLIATGWSHNEIRRALGQPEIDEEWADVHFMTKNYDTIENIMKGGDESENEDVANGDQIGIGRHKFS